MRRKILLQMIAGILVFSSLSVRGETGTIDAKEIIERVDRLLRGDSSHGVATMSIKTEHWERSKTLELWSEGTEKVLIRVLSPRKEEGTATLKVEEDIWNYLPKIDRVIRIPTSMMMASWMGSHFTNDDLVKESQLVEDYDIELTADGEREGVSVWDFRLRPREDTPVVWGAIDYRVRQKDLMPVWAKYYGEDWELRRTMMFSEYQEMGGRLVPARMRLVPVDEPNEFTEILYEELEFNIDLSGRVFSLESLRRR